MVLTTVQGGTLVGTRAPYAAGVNYGAGVNRAGRVAQMQAGIDAGASFPVSSPFVAGGAAGNPAPYALGRNTGLMYSADFRDYDADISRAGTVVGKASGQPISVRLLPGATALGSTVSKLGDGATLPVIAGWAGNPADVPAATFAGQTAQIGSPVAWKAIAPAMDAANPGF